MKSGNLLKGRRRPDGKIMHIPAGIEAKYQHLQEILIEIGKPLIAFSGGVDSTFLLKTAVDVLGKNAKAVIAESELLARKEIAEAEALAGRLGVPLRRIRLRALDNEDLAMNPPRRCYVCKKDIFSRFIVLARKERLRIVCDGSNIDDAGDYRPGTEALRELGIRSPLREAGLNKADIRSLSRRLGLPTWDKPSLACLASRFPYGIRIDRAGLRRVEAAEESLAAQGFRQVRVRDHGTVARIELAPAEMGKIVKKGRTALIVSSLKRLGYSYVALDLEGYRTGSLNETLPSIRSRKLKRL